MLNPQIVQCTSLGTIWLGGKIPFVKAHRRPSEGLDHSDASSRGFILPTRGAERRRFNLLENLPLLNREPLVNQGRGKMQCRRDLQLVTLARSFSSHVNCRPIDVEYS
jgi:hypothetical protein